MMAPDRTVEQRLAALRDANDVRARRADLKRDLKAGRRTLEEVLAQPPAYLDTMKVFDLLFAAPRYGRVKVNKVLTRCSISPSRSLGGLTERQRRALCACIARASRDKIEPMADARARFREQMSTSVQGEGSVSGS